MKSKIQLNNLKVNSFITEVKEQKTNTAKGGTGYFENNYGYGNNYNYNFNYNYGGNYIAVSYQYSQYCGNNAGGLGTFICC